MVNCTECDGRGTWIGSIETITLDRAMDKYDELLELQKDAKRVIRQASKLKELRPERSQSYDEQLRGCLFVINGQAEKVTSQK